MCLIRWSPASSSPVAGVEEDRVRRRVAGPVEDLRACGRRTPSSPPSCSSVVTGALPPQPRNARDTRAQRGDDVARDAVAQHQRLRRARRCAPRARRSPRPPARGASSAQTSAPERSASTPTRPRWSLCWWVMTIRSRSSTVWPCSRSAVLERRRATCPSSARRRPASAGRPRSGRQFTRPTANGVGIGSAWITSGSARAPRRAGAPCPPARRGSRGSAAAAARCWTGAR